MASYNRLGSFLLAEALATTPSGAIHRALSTMGASFERHYLLLTFSDELLNAGLASHWPEVQRLANDLAGTRGLGANYRLDTAKPAHLTCDYIPGRTLAQVLAKIREEQIPLGVDHALTVLQNLAQAIILMQAMNIHHGTLSPHSVWIGYEGAAQIIDAPAGSVLQTLLPKAPSFRAAMAPYQCAADVNPFQRDLFALGAILYELLTLEKLPTEGIAGALAQATLKAAQEAVSIPEEILQLLQRLLMLSQPFSTAKEFHATLDRVLYDGDYSPTTFNMAFLMHTLFRDESEQDSQAMKDDQGRNYASYLGPGEGALGGQRAGKAPIRTLYYVLAGGGMVVAATLGVMFYLIHQDNREHLLEQQSLRAKLATFQREKEENDARLADLAKQEEAAKVLESMFGKQAEQANTVEARASAKKDLETAKQKTRDLAKQRTEAMRERQKLAQVGHQGVQQPQTSPASGPAAPVSQPSPSVQDAPPAVTQKGSAASPRAGTRDALPASLQQTDIKVALRVFVDTMGRPQKVVIVKGVDGNYGYNDSAQSAALTSSFSAGIKNGKPAAGWASMEFNFGKPR